MRKSEEGQGERERPEESLDRFLGFPGVFAGGGESRANLFDDLGERGRSAEVQVSAALRGEGLERFGRETGAHDLTPFVLHEDPGNGLAVVIELGNDGSLGRANPDGDEGETIHGGALADALDFLESLEGLAIGEKDEGAGTQLRFLHGLESERDGSAEIGPTAGDDLGVELLDGLENGLVIDGERRLQEGFASKGDEADALVGEGEDDVLRGEFGAVKPVWGEIVGEHAARGVDREDEVAGLDLIFGFLKTQLGTGKGEEHAKKGEGLEHEDAPAARVGRAIDETMGEARRDEPGEAARGAKMRPDPQDEQRQEDESAPEPLGL